MIHWSLQLTGNQIAILKALEPRRYGESEYSSNGVSHWISGIRPLIKEGLIEHFETKNPKTGYMDPLRSGQFLTDRGRFILHMIEEDVARFLSVTESRPEKKSKRAA